MLLNLIKPGRCISLRLILKAVYQNRKFIKVIRLVSTGALMPLCLLSLVLFQTIFLLYIQIYKDLDVYM